MTKYVDANKLIVELERRREKCADIAADERNEEVAEYYRGKGVAYDETSSPFASLQQEQPEESIAKEAIQLVFEEKLTPFKDGNQWSFLLGHNIQEGVCGFGDTILDAAIDFYKNYSTTRIHIEEFKKTMEHPEVDLEKEMKEYFKGWTENEEGIACHYQYVDLNTCHGIARHFWNKGYNARKEE